nr:MAG TPA: hypothetical protein [Crassvirales sp.]
MLIVSSSDSELLYLSFSDLYSLPTDSYLHASSAYPALLLNLRLSSPTHLTSSGTLISL